jgi:hypothetical protein
MPRSLPLSLSPSLSLSLTHYLSLYIYIYIYIYIYTYIHIPLSLHTLACIGVCSVSDPHSLCPLSMICTCVFVVPPRSLCFLLLQSCSIHMRPGKWGSWGISELAAACSLQLNDAWMHARHARIRSLCNDISMSSLIVPDALVVVHVDVCLCMLAGCVHACMVVSGIYS